MAEVITILARGANAPVAGTSTSVAVDWSSTAAADIYACFVATDGKMRTREDAISAGHIAGQGPIIAKFGRSPKAAFAVDLAQVSADVAKIVFCIAVAAGKSALLSDLKVTLFGTEGPTAQFDLPDDLSDDAAVVMAELYRRGAGWKVRAVGQGFKDGLPRLAEFLGCDPEDLREAAKPRAVVPEPSGAQPLRQNAATSSQQSTPPPAQSTRASARVESRDAALALPADLFSCRGWLLSEEGVVPSGPLPKGVSLHDRELLDLTSDGQNSLWPAAFQFQPWTGENLAPRPAQYLTAGRAVAPSGLPHLEWVKALDPTTKEEEMVPEGAKLFSSGGSPARLVAIDPVNGRAWWRAPITGKWIALGRCPASHLPDFAAGAAGTTAGVFYVAESALVHLLPDQKPMLKTLPIAGLPVGSPATIDGVVAVPVRSEAGISFFVRTVDATLVQVPITPAGSKVADEVFGQPVVNAGVAFWVGQGGYLSLDVDPQQFVAKWNPWPAGTEGIPFLTPYRSANGRLWAMARQSLKHGDAGGKALVCLMSAGGGRETHELLGPHLSAGAQTFRAAGRYQEPWGDAVEEINVGVDYEGRAIVPLLRLGNRETIVALIQQNANGRGMREFIFREGPSPSREIVLALHGDNRALKLLGQVFKIKSTDDVALFVKDERICVHHFESNQCVSWSVSSYR